MVELCCVCVMKWKNAAFVRIIWIIVLVEKNVSGCEKSSLRNIFSFFLETNASSPKIVRR